MTGRGGALTEDGLTSPLQSQKPSREKFFSPYWGAPRAASLPHRRNVSIKGASILQVGGDKIASDQSYFDRAAFDEQMG